MFYLYIFVIDLRSFFCGEGHSLITKYYTETNADFFCIILSTNELISTHVCVTYFHTDLTILMLKKYFKNTKNLEIYKQFLNKRIYNFFFLNWKI